VREGERVNNGAQLQSHYGFESIAQTSQSASILDPVIVDKVYDEKDGRKEELVKEHSLHGP
jgi:hypothetical protein